MRKLLILMLVLGMASMASALPTITVSDSTPNPGDTIQVYITGTAAEACGTGGVPIGGYSGFLAIDYVAYGPPGGSPYLAWTGGPAVTTAAGGNASASPTTGMQYYAAIPVAPWTEPTDVDIGLWFTFDVLVTGAAGQSEVIDLLNNVVGGIGQVQIDIVPEPMTMALLGLGGLFLRRRK